MKFRPCIDLHHGAVKQIVGSTLTDADAPVVNFEADQSPAEFAAMYAADGLTGGHVIMLGGGNAEAARAALAAYPGGLQVGGGITPAAARPYLEAGASHVIVTSYVFREGRVDEARLAEMVDSVGSQRLVLDLSCRQRNGGKEGGGSGYYVVTDRWQRFTDVEVTEASLASLAAHCDEFLVHGVDVEGLQVGVIEDLVSKLGAWSPIPVTYAGGARSLADLERVERLGGGKVDLTVGSALDIFGGELPYADVVAWHKERNPLPASKDM